MEKYATDLESILATEEQLADIKKLGGNPNDVITYKDAEDLIIMLGMEKI